VSESRRAVDAGWWREFVAAGDVPACFERVQGRLIRAVHRAELGGEEVFVKTMTFPRWKDRVRYLVRRLPAAHEARLLRATAAAGIPCPDVVAVYTRRRAGLPHRSMLVLRALPVAAADAPREDRVQRVTAEVVLAAGLLRAGIHHRDLHTENFVRLDSGGLAVLDMQSARITGGVRRSSRLAVAARMLRELEGATEAAAVDAMRRSGLLRSDDEVDVARRRRDRLRAGYEGARVRRCLQTSTEFERRPAWRGVRYARRDRAAGGRWLAGGRALLDAWIGQRVLELREQRAPLFGAYFRKWWWLGGGGGLYVPAQCSDAQIEAEVRFAAAAGRAWRGRSPA